MKEPAFFEIHTIAKAGEPPSQNGVPSVERLLDGKLLCVWSHNPFIEERKADPQTVLDILRHPGMILGSFSSDNGCVWSEPVVLADQADGDPSLTTAGSRVLLQYSVFAYLPRGREIYYDGNSRFMQRFSSDLGNTWGEPVEITVGRRTHCAHGNGLRLRDGAVIRPDYYCVNLNASEEIPEKDMICASGILRSDDEGETWVEGGVVRFDSGYGIGEPALAELSNGDLYMLNRTSAGYLYQATSRDKGGTWSSPMPSTLVSSSAPCALYRLSFKPNRIIVAWNNSASGNRYPLDVAISYDDCRTWEYSRTLFNPGRQVAYPSITAASDGSIIIVFHENSDISDKRIKWHYWRNIYAARISEEWIRG